MMRAGVSGMVLGGLLMLAASQAASSQELLLHFPLDGTPAAAGSAAGDSRLYLFDGGPAPTAVPGRIGNALHFSGKAAIAMPFKLDPVTYPQVTITAWVRLDASPYGGTIFSAGNGNVPKLMVNVDRNNITGGRGSLIAKSGMPRDEWVFVAGVVDVRAARLENVQGEAAITAEGVNVGNLYPPSSYRNPDDPSLPAMPYVFVGSHGFGQWRASGMAIDDVRVYASALTPGQVAAIREAGGATTAVADSAGAGTCGGGAACATGTYCAVDGNCYPDSQLPVGYSPSTDGPGLAGRWQYFSSTPGGLMSSGSSVFMEMEFTGPDSQMTGTIRTAVSSSMGGMEGSEAMSNVVRSGNTLTFKTASIACFSGQISVDGSQITTRSIDPTLDMVFTRLSADGSAPSSSGSPNFYQAPLTEESLAHVQEIRDENAAPMITYASEEEALAAQERREQEAAELPTDDAETPMQAGSIDAVMDLQKIVIRQQNENRGDEYYLVLYQLRGRRGTGDRIYTFDYQRQVWPIAAGDNWAVRGSEFTIPQGAGRLSYTSVEPFEVYGFVAVLMEANNNTQAERQAAFGFGEFQNESGVTEVVGSAFDRAIPRDGQRPDYGDTTCSNVFRVADQNAHGLSQHFNFVGMPEEGLAKAIRDAIRVPLQRSNPDRYDGAIWGFFMNSLGGSTCGDPFYRDREAYRVGIFLPPGAAPVGMSTESTTIYVKHSR